MGLEKNTGKMTFVNISNGRLYTKEKNEQPEYFGSIDGIISEVKFKEEEYEGKKYEKAEIILFDGEERFCLGMRTDSGYFRGFCNSLKTGNPTGRMKISPSYKVKDEKPQTTCFVQQNGKALKHAYTLDNIGDLPPVQQVQFKGKIQYDGTAQIKFWKDWLSSIRFDNPQEQIDNNVPDHEQEEEQLDDGLPF